eukprot:GHVT01073992.1.p1 GENE.GHVT01073992.1~~GHVT01073992.1.p1  ORF type:complete len:127 (-),score=21.11 GHVT01073992.1:85-465(-)
MANTSVSGASMTTLTECLCRCEEKVDRMSAAGLTGPGQWPEPGDEASSAPASPVGTVAVHAMLSTAKVCTHSRSSQGTRPSRPPLGSTYSSGKWDADRTSKRIQCGRTRGEQTHYYYYYYYFYYFY